MTHLRYPFPIKGLVIATLTLVAGLTPLPIQAQAPRSLYMISIGISHYQSPGMNLQSASKDAVDVANAFRAQQGKLFQYVDVTTLTDAQATGSNIRSALGKLRHKATADSYVLVYLAGHGNNGVAGEYRFQAYDYNPQQNKTWIIWREFQEALSQLPGKAIVIMDSCRSGGVGIGSNLIVFSSALCHQNAGESANNGYFTQALLEALSGRADTNKNNIITLAEIDAYVSERVEQLSFGAQQISLTRPPNIPSTMPIVSLFNANPGVVSTPAATTPWIVNSPPPSPSSGITSSGPIHVPTMANPPVMSPNIQSSGPLRVSNGQ